MVTRTKTRFAGYECVKLENEALALWLTLSVGPRIIGLALPGGENLFAGDGELSELALCYVGGVLAHGRSLMALTNPSTNSYRRLVPGYEAPVNLAYSSRNRSAAVRISSRLPRSWTSMRSSPSRCFMPFDSVSTNLSRMYSLSVISST